MSREIKCKAWNKVRRMMSDPFRVLGQPMTADGKPIGIQLSEDLEIVQFTGLTDKKGREICEGDIAADEEGPYFVQWCAKYGYWAISTVEVECCDHLSEWLDDFVVLGNIYENPELLEV